LGNRILLKKVNVKESRGLLRVFDGERMKMNLRKIGWHPQEMTWSCDGLWTSRLDDSPIASVSTYGVSTNFDGIYHCCY